MIGIKNNILEVISFYGLSVTDKKNKRKRLWNCICKCGKNILRTTAEINRKTPESCGCWRLGRKSNNKTLNILNTTHGLSKHPLFRRWMNIKQRCYNEKHPFFKYYGFKGIVMCEEWKNNFKAFFDWCINNSWKKELVIDRIDSNSNYEPNNCQFLTPSENTKKANLNNIVFKKKLKEPHSAGY